MAESPVFTTAGPSKVAFLNPALTGPRPAPTAGTVGTPGATGATGTGMIAANGAGDPVPIAPAAGQDGGPVTGVTGGTDATVFTPAALMQAAQIAALNQALAQALLTGSVPASPAWYGYPLTATTFYPGWPAGI